MIPLARLYQWIIRLEPNVLFAPAFNCRCGRYREIEPLGIFRTLDCLSSLGRSNGLRRYWLACVFSLHGSCISLSIFGFGFGYVVGQIAVRLPEVDDAAAERVVWAQLVRSVEREG